MVNLNSKVSLICFEMTRQTEFKRFRCCNSSKYKRLPWGLLKAQCIEGLLVPASYMQECCRRGQILCTRWTLGGFNSESVSCMKQEQDSPAGVPDTAWSVWRAGRGGPGLVTQRRSWGTSLYEGLHEGLKALFLMQGGSGFCNPAEWVHNEGNLCTLHPSCLE